MEYIIEVKNLEKKYGNFKALNNLNIHIEKGSIYGLVGKNGAGKTTLIRLLCGLEEPTSGTYSIYRISNKDKSINKERQKIGAIIEYPCLYYNMNAYDNNDINDKNEADLIEILNTNLIEDPLDTITQKEYYKIIENAIDKSLSSFEKQVLNFYVQGQSYGQIAEKLNTPVKSVDNAIQRIRKKACMAKSKLTQNGEI